MSFSTKYVIVYDKKKDYKSIKKFIDKWNSIALNIKDGDLSFIEYKSLIKMRHPSLETIKFVPALMIDETKIVYGSDLFYDLPFVKTINAKMLKNTKMEGNKIVSMNSVEEKKEDLRMMGSRLAQSRNIGPSASAGISETTKMTTGSTEASSKISGKSMKSPFSMKYNGK